jgi:ABC-type transport system substrate-binding protein
MNYKVPGFPIALVFFASIALGAGASDGAKPETPKRGGVLRLDIPSDIHSLDPTTIFSGFEGIVGCMVYRSLLDHDQNENIIPMLAETLPQISADRLTYTFPLRHGVRFSNGREVVANDWVYSFERHLDPRNNSSYTNYYIKITGATAFKEARAKEQAAGAASSRATRTIEPKTVSGLQAIDRYTLQIHLENPDAIFSDVLATPVSFVVPREEVERLGNAFATHPVGCGPFVLAEWAPGVNIRLDRNPNYFRSGEPHLDHVDIAIGPDAATEIMMFERGELDYVPMVSSADYLRLKRSPTLRHCMYPLVGGDVIYISLNCELPPFTDVRVRRAINYAVNKQRILKVMLDRGSVAHGLLTPVNKGYNEKMSPYPYDPDKARALLAEAGYAGGFETQLVVASDTELYMKAALIVQRDLAAVGIKMELKKVQGQALYVGQKRKTVPMEVWDWAPNFNDPEDSLNSLVNGERITDESCLDTAFYSSDKVNRLFHRGSAEFDPAKRLRIYQRIEEQVFDDAPYVFLIQVDTDELHQPWLKGVKPRAIWPARLENAWIDR